jgi:hypothetical protein
MCFGDVHYSLVGLAPSDPEDLEGLIANHSVDTQAVATA